MFKRLIFLTSFVLVLALVSTNVALGDVIDIRISAGTDDAEEAANTGFQDTYNTSSDLEIPNDHNHNGGMQFIGLNFRDIAISPGVNIDSAYIEFVCDASKFGDGDAYLLIWGHLAPNPDGFANPYPTMISDRPRTQAQVQWEPEQWAAAGQISQTADISAIILELINQEGWAAGNAIEIIIGEDTSKRPSDGFRNAESFNGSADLAPLLHVEFSDAPAPLPEGWQSQDIGTTGGSTAESEGTWAISADGADIWGSVDEFHYAYVPLSGDGTIIAQVISNGEGSNSWAKGGVMIRETLDQGSKHAIMAMTGGDGGGIAFQGRPETDGDSWGLQGDITASLPQWLKLTRVGNTITGYYSADGVAWELMTDTSPDGDMTDPIDIEMAADVYIGLFTTSHAAGELRTYTFDNVSIELPPPRAMDNWEAAVAPAAPGFLATNIEDGIYDIGAFSGDMTYEFCVLSNPDETEASMALIGRRNYGDTQAGLKFDQWNDTGEYGATVFGVVDLYYGVPYNAGVDTHLVFVSSEDAGRTELYVNGVFKGSVDSAITLSGIVGIGLAAQAEDGSDTFDNFDGDVFGVAIYDTALSDEEIAAHSDAFLGRVVKINFQQAGGDVPAGYLPDYGEAFGDRGNGYSYGWDLDIQDTARDRDHENSGGDQRYDTTIHLQKAENAVWEIELPNGAYELFLVGGDPGYTDQINNFDVEGVIVLGTGLDESNFDEYNITAVVSDGALTIQPAEGASNAKIMFVDITALVDVTAPGDLVQGVPNDGLMDGNNFGWPGAETPDLAVDDNTGTKFLHFKGELEPTGIQVTPAAGPSIVTGLTLTTANDAIERDPISFELSGSNEGIDGPYELIASGDIVDFSDPNAWPRFTMNATPISFDNDVAYAHYQVLFPAVRDAASANSMQIAEVELLGVRIFPPAPPIVHYMLDDGEGVIAVDSSGNGLDGILMGDPLWSAGLLDGALDFDGVDDYVDCGTSEALNNLSDAMTVSAWVNIRSVTTTWMGIVMKGETAWRLGVNGDTTGIHFGFTGGDRGWQAANSVTELPLDEWHHIAGTYDRSVGATNYIDGVAETVNPDPDGVRTNEMPLLLGENPEALGRLFDGLLDDVRIYDRALSADELSGLAAQ